MPPTVPPTVMSPTVARRTLVALLLALCTAISGCATVPESSDLQVVRSLQTGPQVPSPEGPERGVDPFRLVRGFIEATGNPTGQHAAARAHLTAEAAESWDDSAVLTVIEDAPGATPERGTEPGVRTIRVQGPRLGVITPDGSFTPEPGEFSVEFDVVQEHGEWRISNPPPGVLVESSAIQRHYRQVGVSFIDPKRGTLVPDLRWVPAHPASTLTGRVFDLLLAGPSDTLSGAVVSALPPDARLRSNVLVSSDGRTVINITGLEGLAEQDRRLVAAQIVSTLDGLVPTPLRLLADDEPLVPGQPEWNLSDIAVYTSSAGPRPDVSGKVVVDGTVRGLDGESVPDPTGDSSDSTVRSIAYSSPGAEHVAVVATGPNDNPELRVGRRDERLVRVPMDAVAMTRPTWRPSGTEVWTVINGQTVAGVALAETGPSEPYQVNAGELTEFGVISELRISPDGARVAAVAGGNLLVATVVTESGEVSLRRPRVLRDGDLPPTAAVDWARPELLVVASDDQSPQVSLVSADGLTRRQLPSTNLTGPLTGITAAPGRDIVVADATGLWAYSDTQEVWEPLLGGIGPGAVPAYPG